MYTTKIYRDAGGDRQVVASGGEVLVQSGGKQTVFSGGAIDQQAGAKVGRVCGATFTLGAEANDARNVGIQLKDALGADLNERACIFAYLSDDAEGDDLTATAPAGGAAIGTDGVAIPVVTNKAWQLVSEDDGDIDITITHATGAKTWYLILVMPNGTLVASAAIAFAA